MPETRGPGHQSPPRISALLMSGSFLLCILLTVSQAQITLDGSLGSRVPLIGPDYTILAEMGQQRGGNLFHSFDRFNVGSDESATFTGPDTMNNIIGRVTGAQPSTIDGRLRSGISGANLFLLNPRGVFVGSNARLDISGSFHIATADFLRFTDGMIFSAHLGQGSTLTMASPTAFGFWNRNPAGISIQESTLYVPEGEAMSVIGGDIHITGSSLQAPSGRIHIASVASEGEVVFDPTMQSLDLGVASVQRLGEIDIMRGTRIDVSGDGGGTVVIRGGRLMVNHSSLLANTQGNQHGNRISIDLQVTEQAYLAQNTTIAAERIASFSGRGNAGNIQIKANSLYIDDSTVGTTVGLFASGNAGDIDIQTGRLHVTRGADISAGTMGIGSGGMIKITATDAVMIADRNNSGSHSRISSFTADRGNAGNLFIQAPSVVIEDGLIGTGNARGMGNAGDINVEVGRLFLREGGRIDSSTFGAGSGGVVMVIGTEAITITGRSATTGAPSGLFNVADGGGDAGSLILSAPTVSLHNGGLILAETTGEGGAGDIIIKAEYLTLSGGARIDSRSRSAGSGGRVTVMAEEVITITGQDSGLFTTAEGSGRGGDIFLQAQTIELTGAASISAASFGTGNAGSIGITATGSFLSANSTVTTSAAASDGGDIEVRAQSIMRLQDSQIRAAVDGGPGTTGGNIIIESELVTLENSQVIADAFEGMGGNIRIVADGFLRDADSRVSASSDLGIDGTVEIQTLTNLSGLVTPLSPGFVSTTALLRDPCATQLWEGTVSSFVVVGRDIAPQGPEAALSSPLVMHDQGPLAAKSTMDDIDDGDDSRLPSPLQSLRGALDHPLWITRRVVDDADLKIHDQNGTCVPIQLDLLSHDVCFLPLRIGAGCKPAATNPVNNQ